VVLRSYCSFVRVSITLLRRVAGELRWERLPKTPTCHPSLDNPRDSGGDEDRVCNASYPRDRESSEVLGHRSQDSA
jgi:hypothetical protein